MNFEKQYYEYDGFWSDYETLYKNNIEKINITFGYLKNDIASVLDAACGSGLFTNMLAEQFPSIKVVGFDRSEAALKYVKTEKLVAEIDNIPFGDNEFDCVVAHDVIEHLPVGVYDKALNEIAQVAKKYIIIGVPNDEKVLDRSTQCPSCKATFNYDLHMRSFPKEKMRQLFSKQGFNCVDIQTCDRNSFYVGQQLYGNLFVPSINRVFKSPICPVCGYSELAEQDFAEKQPERPVAASSGIIGILKKIPKLLWPKYSFDYEMVALFKKM